MSQRRWHRPARPARRGARRPRLEALEDRRLLATFTVTNTNKSGAGSLRQAILDSNQAAGADMIAFAIPGPGVHTIAPTSTMPDVTGPVTIDGYTQPGARPNTLADGDNAALMIQIDAT